MRRKLLLPLFAGVSGMLYAQMPADTILHLQNIEVQGVRFAGLSDRQGMRFLDVNHNLSSAPQNTADALRQLPSVITDIEGGITFRGSNQPGILINGIPYGLLEEYSGDVLIQLPALFFEQLAVGATPRIDWVPDGNAGVVNLSPRIYTAADSPLQVTLGGGWHERYNAGAVLNLHPGKWSINAKYNYRKEYRYRSFSKVTTTPKNRQEMHNNGCARPDVHMAYLQLGYAFSNKDEVSAKGIYHVMDYFRHGRINNQVFNPKGEQMKHVIRNRYNDQKQESYGAEASWTHQFSDSQRLITTFNYNRFTYDEDNDYKNENPKTGAIAAEDNLFVDKSKNLYYWQVAYEADFDGWQLNAGYTGRSRHEDYETHAAVKGEQGFAENKAKSYLYDYDRRLHLLYAGLSKQWGALQAEVGAQAELSHTNMTLVGGSTTNVDSNIQPTNSFHLYPRTRFSYQFDKQQQMQLSYQQRVIRPTGSLLAPFKDTSDATHVFQGNPDLKDELIHQVELSYHFSTPQFRLSPALYYRNRANRIMEVAKPEVDDNYWLYQNVDHSQTVGIDLSANWNPCHIVTIGFSGDLYHDEIDGHSIGYDMKKGMTCWDVKGNVNLAITPTTQLQVDGFYVSDQLTAQGDIKHRYSVNAGLSQHLLQRKLCVNLSVNNLFDSLEEVTTINTSTMQLTQKRNRDARVAWLTLTYSL